MKPALQDDHATHPAHDERDRSHVDLVILADDAERATLIRRQLEGTVYAGARTSTYPLKVGLRYVATSPARLILLDVQANTMDPLQVVKQIRQQATGVMVVIITRDSNAALAQRALRAGASAYLTNAEAETMLATALEQVDSGERFVSEEIMQGILHGMVETGHNEDRIPIEMLSDREMVIFQMIGHGKPFREIAGELNVNIKTVATHCNNIRRKLHSRDNRHLTRLCQSWVADRQLNRA